MFRIFTILAMLSVANISNAQTYVPFPTSGDSAVWFQSYSSINSNGYYELFIDGDTIIDGLEYVKIYETYDGSMPGYYLAAIREANKVVYLRSMSFNNLTADTILYDFNVQVGDTLNWFGMEGLFVYVSAIDSVLVNGIHRKRFQLISEMTWDFYLIEGIGSTSGLIPGYIEFEGGTFLHCFRLNGNIIWQNSQWNTGCYVSTNELKGNSKITINPNPTNDYLNLTFETIEPREFLILNALGQIVFNEKSTDSEVILNVQTLPQGFYVLAIRTEKGTVTKRIIKQ